MAVAAEVHVFAAGLQFCFAVFANSEVGVIAGVMAFGIIEAVLLAIGIEVRAG